MLLARGAGSRHLALWVRASSLAALRVGTTLWGTVKYSRLLTGYYAAPVPAADRLLNRVKCDATNREFLMRAFARKASNLPILRFVKSENGKAGLASNMQLRLSSSRRLPKYASVRRRELETAVRDKETVPSRTPLARRVRCSRLATSGGRPPASRPACDKTLATALCGSYTIGKYANAWSLAERQLW